MTMFLVEEGETRVERHRGRENKNETFVLLFPLNQGLNWSLYLQTATEDK